MDAPGEVRRKLLGEELDRLLRVLTEDSPPPERVILFGSMARGVVGEWTDLDVVIVQSSSLPFFERIGWFYKLFRPRAGMDVLIYTPEEFARLVRTRWFFQEEFLGKGRVIYDRSSTLA